MNGNDRRYPKGGEYARQGADQAKVKSGPANLFADCFQSFPRGRDIKSPKLRDR
jgi:hypothetical protein